MDLLWPVEFFAPLLVPLVRWVVRVDELFLLGAFFDSESFVLVALILASAVLDPCVVKDTEELVLAGDLVAVVFAAWRCFDRLVSSPSGVAG